MPENVASFEPQHDFLEMRNVNVARGDRLVLHDVNLTIHTGEHVAILGPNGCGKSTLILTMSCQLYPIVQPGMSVRIFGRERWDLSQLRRHFGVVAAGTRGLDLPGERTAVTTGRDAVIAGFFSASTLWPNLVVTDDMRHRAAEAIERMEATHLADQLVGEMSAGEKRRILIARALVHRPRQLLLDEPSNALDLAAQRDLRETLRRLAAEGTGLVLVTHHLGDILPEITRIILMQKGRIDADGPRAQLLTEPRLSQLFQAPVRIGHDDNWLHSW
ncbi:MAG TPA: ATP-binding cassette domain-containing protein [Terracidiphilus sp.]|jgi:iron complex transport system ATP-binding protein|nr:ATP-binding cassette domain-containing protein [Terracidiphilus sp.]